MLVRATELGYDGKRLRSPEDGPFEFDGPLGSWMERVDGKAAKPAPAPEPEPFDIGQAPGVAAALAVGGVAPIAPGEPIVASDRKALLAQAKAKGIKGANFLKDDQLRAKLAEA